ncbi:MAG: hypothetical protein AAFO94_22260, partial [Bacteroidota bacterium]
NMKLHLLILLCLLVGLRYAPAQTFQIEALSATEQNAVRRAGKAGSGDVVSYLFYFLLDEPEKWSVAARMEGNLKMAQNYR